MKAISYSDARQNLAKAMDAVCDDHAPLLITRQRARPVILMSLDDYNALEETAYLLSNPQNAQRLRESIAQLEKGKGRERQLID